VYSVSWSCCDAWIFASLSYDGRVSDTVLAGWLGSAVGTSIVRFSQQVVVNHVPPAEKYKILL
jgi:hypothetical protein